MEKSEIPEILNFMNALYPNRKLKNDFITCNTWYSMLKDYTKDEVIHAIKTLASVQTYIPNLPEIIKSIQPSFDVEIEILGHDYAIYVKFPDAMYPFKFRDKIRANDFLNMLKQERPRVEIIEDLYQKNLHNRLGVLKEDN